MAKITSQANPLRGNAHRARNPNGSHGRRTIHQGQWPLAAQTGRTQTCNRRDRSDAKNALDPRRASTQSPSSDESAANRDRGNHREQHLGNATGLVSFLSDLLRLQHALPDGFHHIRHYGFLANRHRSDKLARCRELFSVTASALAALDWALLGDATQSTAVRS